MPSPNIMGSVLAKLTNGSNVAIVQMGANMPTSNPPIRVAEEYAMLDCISGGRLDSANLNFRGQTRLLRAGEATSPLHRPRPTLSPLHPELLFVLLHDRSRRLQPDPDAASFVDIGTLGGHAPDDILSGQYRCHRSPP